MKIAVIALVFLIFNFCMGLVTYSGVASGSIYYEPSYVETYTPGGDYLPHNLSAGSETEQYSQTMGMVNVIFGTLTFNWLYEYVPADIKSAEIVTYFFTGLNAVLGFLYAAAIIELFMKQQEVIR